MGEQKFEEEIKHTKLCEKEENTKIPRKKLLEINIFWEFEIKVSGKIIKIIHKIKKLDQIL